MGKEKKYGGILSVGRKSHTYRSRSLISRNRRSIAIMSSTNPSSGGVSGGGEDGVVCSDEEERSDSEEEGEGGAITGQVGVLDGRAGESNLRFISCIGT
jgi:hypothetical protein